MVKLDTLLDMIHLAESQTSRATVTAIRLSPKAWYELMHDAHGNHDISPLDVSRGYFFGIPFDIREGVEIEIFVDGWRWNIADQFIVDSFKHKPEE